jgi:hypothetical protein
MKQINTVMLTLLADDRSCHYMIQNHNTMLKEKIPTTESWSDVNLKLIQPMNLGRASWKQCGNAKIRDCYVTSIYGTPENISHKDFHKHTPCGQTSEYDLMTAHVKRLR